MVNMNTFLTNNENLNNNQKLNNEGGINMMNVFLNNNNLNNNQNLNEGGNTMVKINNVVRLSTLEDKNNKVIEAKNVIFDNVDGNQVKTMVYIDNRDSNIKPVWHVRPIVSIIETDTIGHQYYCCENINYAVFVGKEVKTYEGEAFGMNALKYLIIHADVDRNVKEAIMKELDFNCENPTMVVIVGDDEYKQLKQAVIEATNEYEYVYQFADALTYIIEEKGGMNMYRTVEGYTYDFNKDGFELDTYETTSGQVSDLVYVFDNGEKRIRIKDHSGFIKLVKDNTQWWVNNGREGHRPLDESASIPKKDSMYRDILEALTISDKEKRDELLCNIFGCVYRWKV